MRRSCRLPRAPGRQRGVRVGQHSRVDQERTDGALADRRSAGLDPVGMVGKHLFGSHRVVLRLSSMAQCRRAIPADLRYNGHSIPISGHVRSTPARPIRHVRQRPVRRRGRPVATRSARDATSLARARPARRRAERAADDRSRRSGLVVPAIHAIWIPPHCRHSLRSFGPISGWSAFVAEARCAALPDTPRAIRTTPLLREAVQRAASWEGRRWMPLKRGSPT